MIAAPHQFCIYRVSQTGYPPTDYILLPYVHFFSLIMLILLTYSKYIKDVLYAKCLLSLSLSISL